MLQTIQSRLADAGHIVQRRNQPEISARPQLMWRCEYLRCGLRQAIVQQCKDGAAWDAGLHVQYIQDVVSEGRLRQEVRCVPA